MKKQINRLTSTPKSVLFYMAWRNLYAKKLRSSLTIIGIVIGIGSIFFLLSLGLGLQGLVTNEVIGNQTTKSIDVTSPNSRIIKLDKDASDRIAGLGNVGKIGNSYTLAGSLSLNNSETDTIVYGIDANYQEISNLSAIKGRLLNNEDTNSAYLNRAALGAIGIDDPAKIIDKELTLNIPLSGQSENNTESVKQSYKIIGVIDSGSGSEVFVSKWIFDQAQVGQYSQVKLVAKETNAISDIRKQIESMGFETSSPIDTIDQINQVFRYFNLILIGFGAIGMIIAILGMFNTITISLLERTKEIGLMVAIGARKKDMRKLFIIESVLLSLIGSAIGILMASITGLSINIFMNHLANSRGVSTRFDLFATPIWLVLALMLFMVAIGLLVVLIPSRRAERINPIDALRRE